MSKKTERLSVCHCYLACFGIIALVIAKILEIVKNEKRPAPVIGAADKTPVHN